MGYKGGWQRGEPVSPLAAERYARRWTGQQVCELLRALCPGHGGKPCEISRFRLSEYETGRRPPVRAHTIALCRLYGRGPEELGLLVWRSPAEREAEAAQERARLRAEVRREVLAELEELAASGVVVELAAAAVDGDGARRA